MIVAGPVPEVADRYQSLSEQLPAPTSDAVHATSPVTLKVFVLPLPYSELDQVVPSLALSPSSGCFACAVVTATGAREYPVDEIVTPAFFAEGSGLAEVGVTVIVTWPLAGAEPLVEESVHQLASVPPMVALQGWFVSNVMVLPALSLQAQARALPCPAFRLR